MQGMSAQMDASYAQMKKSMDEAPDEATKKVYADMLAGFEKQKAEAAAQKAQEDPALAYNRELLSKHENALNAFTNELAKYEDKPGDAQKSMDDWQKQVEKAKADAGKQ
jgi:chromosome segregation ATPase